MHPLPERKSVYNYYVTVTIQTGLITSVFAVVDLIVYLADVSCASLLFIISSKHLNSQLEREWTCLRELLNSQKNLHSHLIFNFLLCKLYSNSLMSNLNSRKGWEEFVDLESPNVEINLEESGNGQESPSQSSWKLKQIGDEETQDRSKQLDVSAPCFAPQQSYLWFDRAMLSNHSPCKHRHPEFMSRLSPSNRKMLQCKESAHFMSTMIPSPNHSRLDRIKRMLLK